MFNNSFKPLLRQCCLATTKSIFANLPKYGFTVQGELGQQWAYKPGKTIASPLLLCHADTVVDRGNGKHAYTIQGNRVNSIALDDRLGLAMLLYSLKYHTDTLGNCAMLVCDDEERGRSTAQIADVQGIPNWLMEFDRRGSDCVTYEYSSVLWDGILTSIGFEVGRGSFSDICYLDYLGVCGVNVGVGYWNEHSPECFADLSHTWKQFQLAEKLYCKLGDIRLACDLRNTGFTDYEIYS